MPRDATETRQKLIRAGEYLFARHGLDVSISEIHSHAGQKNSSAVHYHFGSKDELLREVIAKHKITDTRADEIRARLAEHADDPRRVVDILIRHHCERLRTEDGRDFARISNHLLGRAPVRRALIDGYEDPLNVSIDAEQALIRSCVPDMPDRTVNERALAGMAFIKHQIAERARSIDEGDDADLGDEEAFVANLVDMATGLLTAPVGAQRATSA